MVGCMISYLSMTYWINFKRATATWLLLLSARTMLRRLQQWKNPKLPCMRQTSTRIRSRDKQSWKVKLAETEECHLLRLQIVVVTTCKLVWCTIIFSGNVQNEQFNSYMNSLSVVSSDIDIQSSMVKSADLHLCLKKWERQDVRISEEELGSLPTADEEVIGIITLEDVMEELLQVSVLIIICIYL